MYSLLVSFISLLAGIVATVLVSRYYFRRSIGKSLTPYLQFSSLPFVGIDPTVRSELKIKYQDHEIDNLYEIQFLIANTGDTAIRDIIEPLSLKIPTSSILLDASILYVYPEGRKIDLQMLDDKKTVAFDIPLLNSRDFFITKFLLNGLPNESNFLFEIVAEELPPNLKPVSLPSDAVGTSNKREFDFYLMLGGVTLILISLSGFVNIYDAFQGLPGFQESGCIVFFKNLQLKHFTAVVGTLPTLLVLFFGILMTLASLTGGVFPPKKKIFIVPNERRLFRTGRFYIPFLSEEYEESQIDASTKSQSKGI